jgi:glycosyltransferase involved in cell wall biosynthesis
MPLFSIIIPTYNRDLLIVRAIDSILDQSFEDFEIIIIDDGSTDNTKKVIKNYTDPRVKYIYQENSERSAARNNGIKNALGIYICFLDSDDQFKKDHLSTFRDEIKKNNFPKCMFYTKILSSDQSQKNYNKYEKILKFMIHPQEVCIHKKIFDEEIFDIELRVVEDFDLWIRIVHKYPLIHINKETIIINDHEDRSVNYLKYNSYILNLKQFNRIYANSKFRPNISKEIIKETISDCHFGIGKYYLYNNNKIIGTYKVIKSILININSSYKYKLNLIFCSFFNNDKLKSLLESE